MKASSDNKGPKQLQNVVNTDKRSRKLKKEKIKTETNKAKTNTKK